MRIGLFGGTFDPIHRGHAALLAAAATGGFFDRIHVIPSAIPPHKSLHHVSMPSYRYEMARIAVKDMDFPIPVVLSDIEIRQNKVSYTIDTVREIAKLYKSQAGIYLICGADVAGQIENWHMPEALLREAGLFLAGRPGCGEEELEARILRLKNKYGTKIERFFADPVDISSMQLREMIASDDPGAEAFLDPGVFRWIRENALYDPAYDFAGCFDFHMVKRLGDMEFALRGILSAHRLIHSLNTMRESVRLGRTFGAPLEKCALAGLLHDCTKISRTDARPADGDDERPAGLEGIPAEIEHAYTGSDYARSVFGIVDEDILNAIRYHTTSRAGASLLEKILFVADKIEPARTFSRIGEIRAVASHDLDGGMRECLRDIMLHLDRQGKTPHPDTVAAYRELL